MKWLLSLLFLPVVAYAHSPENIVPFQCMPSYTLPSDSEFQFLMFDENGFRWILVTSTNSGKQVIGFITGDLFCRLAPEGKIGSRT